MNTFNAVITHNVAPMRAEPNGSSEQVSQAIWGDNALRLAREGEYVRIRTADAYEGWVWERHLRPFDPALPSEEQQWPFGQQVGQAHCVTADFAVLRNQAGNDAAQTSKLVFGTWVQTPLTERPKAAGGLLVQLPIGWQAEDAGRVQAGYVQAETVHSLANWPYPREWDGEAACQLARRFLGTPYLWGGTTPFGFDCSGFAQRIYATFGVTLPRDAYMQAASELGTRLDVDVPAQAGDLVFFGGRSDPRKRGITHVGMALSEHFFIHAVGKEGVIITPFDDPYYAAQYAYCGAWRCALQI